MCKIVDSLHCIPEANITLSVNYNGIKIENKPRYKSSNGDLSLKTF